MESSLSFIPVIIIIAINVIVFALPYLVDFGGYSSVFTLMSMGWKDNASIRDGEWYRLLTSMFLHADFFHLAFNMMSLYSLGKYVLAAYTPTTKSGLVAFLAIYFLSGLAASSLSFFLNPYPSVGASGAVFGLVGAMIAFGMKFGFGSLVSEMFVFVAVNFGYAMLPGSRIDNYGHLGGLVAGWLIGFLLLLAR